MTSPVVSRKEAIGKPTHHQFFPGLGYIKHSGPPELPVTANGNKNCLPPAQTANGSRHLIKPPTGGPAVIMVWNVLEKAWASTRPEKGNRLAWPASYLSRAGWAYVGPDKAAK